MEDPKESLLPRSGPEADFLPIAQMVLAARANALRKVNAELVGLYWQVGAYLSRRLEAAEWGEGTVERLAAYLQTQIPGLKGFNPRGLYRMRQFYEAYRGAEFLSPAVTETPGTPPAEEKLPPPLVQISWTHHLLLLSKTKSLAEKRFYLELAVKEGYSKREFERQIDSGLYERSLLGGGTALSPAAERYPGVREAFRDSYVLEFLNLPEAHTEHDLKKGILASLRKFVLEVGRDFAFVGEEYRLQVGGNDYYADLIFFHRELRCLVVFELKIDDFKPEYLGKLEFYLEALDRNVRKPHENPSVGVVLCKSRDAEVVEYALSRTLSPALVAEYQTRLIDKKLLQDRLHELFEADS